MKKSLAVRCGSQNNAIILQGLIFAFAYAFTALGIMLHALPIASAIVFITIPKSLALVKMMQNDFKTKKWWMGILEDWERHEKEGSDWFMMRLCLSRNIVSDFAVILGITYFFFK